MKNLILSIILLGAIWGVNAQNMQKPIDSLTNMLKTAPNDTTRATILSHMGTICMDNGNYPKGIEYFLKANSIFEKEKNEYGIFDCQNRLGITYSLIGDYKMALQYLSKAKYGINDGRVYDNLALVYYKKNDFDKSLFYYKKALNFYKEKSDTLRVSGVLNGIGSIYEIKKEYNEAISHYNESLKMSELINDKIGIIDAHASLGDIYFTMGDYHKSLKHENISLKLAKEINYQMSIRETEKILSDIYLKLKDCGSSLMHYKNYIETKESLINEDNIKQIVRIEENSRFEKERELAKFEQNKKDIIKAEEIRHQKNQRNVFIGCFLVVLGFSVFLFFMFKKTQRQKYIIEKHKKIVEESRREVMDNINYAKRIQDALMTPLYQINNLLPNSFNLNMPRDIVSGDFLLVEKCEGGIIIAVADCTNHSVSGAMMSILCNNLLNEAITNGNDSPSDILNYANIAISKKFHQTELYSTKNEMDIVKDGMDVIVIKIDFANMKYEYAGAYNPLLIVRNNNLIEIKADKLQLGQTNKKYKNNEGKLYENDVLYLSSDGYADQFSSIGKKFMKKKFKELIVEINNMPIQEQKSMLETTITSWKNGCSQTDDILVMGIKI